MAGDSRSTVRALPLSPRVNVDDFCFTDGLEKNRINE